MLKRTPLYAAHVKLGGRLVEFGGWEMPVQYIGILAEHQAVRNAAGLFDISHMGEVLVNGSGALAFLNQLLTNDVRKLNPGWGQYTLMCNEPGGVVDDLYVFRVDEQVYLLIVNASRISADYDWMERQWRRFPQNSEVKIRNESDRFGAIAIQGPRAAALIEKLFPPAADQAAGGLGIFNLMKNQICRALFGPHAIWISRTGYTGEDGFEIVAPAEALEELWNKTMVLGRPCGLMPVGLGARDTLRTEACYPLYGHELNEQTTPLEAGLGRFVALEKPDFIGRDSLARQKCNGMSKRSIAFKMSGKSAPPRPDYAVWSAGTEAARIGVVTSGTQSPTFSIGVGMAYVPPAFATVGMSIGIEIRGQKNDAVIVSKPIYRKSS